MKIGFTGTQLGMTEFQASMVHLNLQTAVIERGVSEFHHGDCIGADAEAHAFATSLGVKPVIHPPTNPDKRAFCQAASTDIREPKPYLKRNQDIVRDSDIMIAAPSDAQETQRSGTWSTVRFARKLGRQIIIVSPDGTVTDEQNVSNGETK